MTVAAAPPGAPPSAHCRRARPAPSSAVAIDDALDEQGCEQNNPEKTTGDKLRRKSVRDTFVRIAHNRAMASFVYVLGCRVSDRTLTYVGWTTDVDRRLAQHNAGVGARFTRGRNWVLLHIEKFRTRRQAMRREWHLKRDRKFRKALTLKV